MDEEQDQLFAIDTKCPVSTRELLVMWQTQNVSEEARQEIFKVIFDRYQQDMYLFALSKVHLHEDARDICAKVWFLVVQKRILQTFSWDEHARSGDPFKSWLIATVMHKTQEFLREETYDTSLSDLSEAIAFIEQKLSHLDNYNISSEPDLSPKRRKADQILKQVLKEADQILSPTEHKIVLLIYFSNKKAPEIGQLLNMKPATVRQQHGRALEKLKKHFKNFLEKFDEL